MRKILISMATLSLAFTMESANAKEAALTPMQLQAIQQREFETDKGSLFSSVVSVFQDLGYTLNSADVATGFITADSATVNKTSFWDALGYASGSGNTRATAFIEQMPSGRSRVRLNFVSTKQLSGMYGQSARQDKPIIDAAVYQRAFEKIDEALFVRRSIDKPAPVLAPAAAPIATPSPAPATVATPTSGAPAAAPPPGQTGMSASSPAPKPEPRKASCGGIRVVGDANALTCH